LGTRTLAQIVQKSLKIGFLRLEKKLV